MKILITGGAGFIGSHMVDLLLSKNYTVRIIDNLSGGHKKNLKHHYNNHRLHFEKIDICKLNSNNNSEFLTEPSEKEITKKTLHLYSTKNGFLCLSSPGAAAAAKPQPRSPQTQPGA